MAARYPHLHLPCLRRAEGGVNDVVRLPVWRSSAQAEYEIARLQLALECALIAAREYEARAVKAETELALLKEAL